MTWILPGLSVWVIHVIAEGIVKVEGIYSFSHVKGIYSYCQSERDILVYSNDLNMLWHSLIFILIYFFSIVQELQQKANLAEPLASYLIKPVQRITKYQLLMKDLLSCCEGHIGEIKVFHLVVCQSIIYVDGVKCNMIRPY